jgi:hypothetical protein
MAFGLQGLAFPGNSCHPPGAVATAGELCKIGSMERTDVIAVLKAHEQELRTAGVSSVSLFGSVARGDDSAHDIDVAVSLSENFGARGLAISAL